MHDPQTPQQALAIATATTRQAHAAAALPRWHPVAAAVTGALAALLLCTVISDGVGGPVGWIVLLGGIGSGCVYFRLVQQQRGIQRARGVVALPMAEWKEFAALLAVLLVVPLVGYAVSGSDGWVRVVSSVVMGGWIWFAQARPRILSREWRPWKR
ncbi:hypothetical protein [Nocardia africana]|uniref:Uncharacterized protein n=1 Tax=Nocardia africana TaxID=134964 RepID=A0A378X125_9NOCA|nr:hypothetical protein [Nocardia africana]MCC3312339.1 hypothetical protein [Nocardia africana]SUA46351.1 Uncharacterised protein [Nocardia africana]